MRRRLDRCLKNTLGESAKLEKLEPRGNGYVKIEGLSPSEPRENGVELGVTFRTAEHISDERRNSASSALATEIKDFFGKYVRESWKGTDIFDVNAVRIQN